MPNNPFGNPFVIPEVKVTSVASPIPDARQSLAGLIKMQQAQQRLELARARAASAGAARRRGPQEGDHRYGRYALVPQKDGTKKPQWVWGTSDTERNAQEAIAVDNARREILAGDTELQNELKDFEQLSKAGMTEKLDKVRKGIVPRLAQTLGMSGEEASKYITGNAQKILDDYGKKIDEAGVFTQIRQGLAQFGRNVYDTIATIGDTPAERIARGKANNEAAARDLQENAWQENLRRMEQENRSTVMEQMLNPGRSIAMHGTGLAAMMAPAVIGGIVGNVPGAIAGGALGAALPAGGEAVSRVAADDDLTEEAKEQTAGQTALLNTLAMGTVGGLASFLPGPGNLVRPALARRAMTKAVAKGGTPKAVASRMAEGATEAETKAATDAWIRQQAGTIRHPGAYTPSLAQEIPLHAANAAGIGAAFNLGSNAAYSLGTGQAKPFEGLGEAILSGAVLGVPFGMAGRAGTFLRGRPKGADPKFVADFGEQPGTLAQAFTQNFVGPERPIDFATVPKDITQHAYNQDAIKQALREQRAAAPEAQAEVQQPASPEQQAVEPVKPVAPEVQPAETETSGASQPERVLSNQQFMSTRPGISEIQSRIDNFTGKNTSRDTAELINLALDTGFLTSAEARQLAGTYKQNDARNKSIIRAANAFDKDTERQQTAEWIRGLGTNPGTGEAARPSVQEVRQPAQAPAQEVRQQETPLDQAERVLNHQEFIQTLPSASEIQSRINNLNGKNRSRDAEELMNLALDKSLLTSADARQIAGTYKPNDTRAKGILRATEAFDNDSQRQDDARLYRDLRSQGMSESDIEATIQYRRELDAENNGNSRTSTASGESGPTPSMEPTGQGGAGGIDTENLAPDSQLSGDTQGTLAAPADTITPAASASGETNQGGGVVGPTAPNPREVETPTAASTGQGAGGTQSSVRERGAEPAAVTDATGSAGTGEYQSARQQRAGDDNAPEQADAGTVEEPAPNASPQEVKAVERENKAQTPVQDRIQPTDSEEQAYDKLVNQLSNARGGEADATLVEDEAAVIMTMARTLGDLQGTSASNVLANVNFSFNKPQAEQVLRSFEQEAWHGTPYTGVIDKLSTDYLGSGEGAQVHGWGLYVALTERVAKNKYQHGLWNKQNQEKIYPVLKANYGEPIILSAADRRQISAREMDDIGDLLGMAGWPLNDKFNVVYHVLGNTKEKQAFIRSNEARLVDLQDKQQRDRIKQGIQLVKDWQIKEPEIPANRGQRLRLEIPEDNAMLHENKTFAEQSSEVQAALKSMANEYLPRIEEALRYATRDSEIENLTFARRMLSRMRDGTAQDYDGNSIYLGLEDAFKFMPGIENAQKEASLALLRHGIEGIRYKGGRDGECAVIFNGDVIRIVEKFYDQTGGRGRIDFLNDGTAEIVFGNTADASTAVHEFEHFFINEASRLLHQGLIKDKIKRQQLQDDLETLADWAGEKDDKNLINPDKWSVETHEKVAKAFEQYLRDGKAPSAEMRSIFARMKDLLVALYQRAKALLGIDNIPQNIREIFDKQVVGYKTVASNIEAARADALRDVRSMIANTPNGRKGAERLEALFKQAADFTPSQLEKELEAYRQQHMNAVPDTEIERIHAFYAAAWDVKRTAETQVKEKARQKRAAKAQVVEEKRETQEQAPVEKVSEQLEEKTPADRFYTDATYDNDPLRQIELDERQKAQAKEWARRNAMAKEELRARLQNRTEEAAKAANDALKNPTPEKIDTAIQEVDAAIQEAQAPKPVEQPRKRGRPAKADSEKARHIGQTERKIRQSVETQEVAIGNLLLEAQQARTPEAVVDIARRLATAQEELDATYSAVDKYATGALKRARTKSKLQPGEDGYPDTTLADDYVERLNKVYEKLDQTVNALDKAETDATVKKLEDTKTVLEEHAKPESEPVSEDYLKLKDEKLLEEKAPAEKETGYIAPEDLAIIQYKLWKLAKGGDKETSALRQFVGDKKIGQGKTDTELVQTLTDIYRKYYERDPNLTKAEKNTYDKMKVWLDLAGISEVPRTPGEKPANFDDLVHNEFIELLKTIDEFDQAEKEQAAQAQQAAQEAKAARAKSTSPNGIYTASIDSYKQALSRKWKNIFPGTKKSAGLLDQFTDAAIAKALGQALPKGINANDLVRIERAGVPLPVVNKTAVAEQVAQAKAKGFTETTPVEAAVTDPPQSQMKIRRNGHRCV